MKKQNLTEEIYRIRKLINFDSENHRKNTTSLSRLMEEELRSQSLLKEQNDEHCKGNNQIDSVIVKVNKSEKNKNSFNFRITAFFPSTGSSNKVYSETLKNLKGQVLSKLDEKTIEKINKGILSISIVKIGSIWGSASNYLNGPLVPTNWNNRGKISTGYESTVPDIKDKLKGKDNSDWEKNLNYAKNRGNNFLKWINTSGAKEGITLNPKGKFPESKFMILDTGGCIDEKRDIAKYKNPGQSLLVVGSINIVPVMKEFTPEETKECLKGASITIGYIPDGSHTCDYAIFNVYANGVEIGVANLNNGPLDTEGKITDYTKNRKSDGEKGGKRSAEFVLDDKQISEIAENSKNGRVSLSIKGFSSDWYTSKYGDGKKGNTHSDTPTVVVKLNGEVKYNKKPQVKMKRVANPVATIIYSFNPCRLA